MLGLFPGDPLVGFADLRVAFALGLTAHRQVHADLGALAGEVHLQPLDDLGVDILGHSDAMLISPLQGSGCALFGEF